jgi:predicted permease
MREWLTRLWGTVRPGRRDADLEEELRLHLDLAIEEEERRAPKGGNAQRAAVLRVGAISQTMEAFRDQRGLPWLDDLSRDARYGLRGFRRNPTFAAVSVLTLALAIGANTAIFSVIEAVMLRTLPLQSPGDVFFVANGTAERPRLGSNYPYFERVRALGDVFSGVTAYTRSEFKVMAGDSIELAQGQFVSGNYHAVLGVPIAIGHGLSSIDDRAMADAAVAVISDGYWAKRFGRGPDVLGRIITIDGRPTSIVGVTGPVFEGLEPGARMDITLPLVAKTIENPGFLTMHDTWTSMPIVARLRAGVTKEQASAAVDAVFQQYFSEPDNTWLRSGPRSEAFKSSVLLRADRGTSGLRVEYARSLQVLMAMVGVVLLIACANVASLLLARGTARAKEVAVRMSVGASRARLIRQFLVEGLLLSLAGGALGLVLSRLGADAIVALVAIGQNPTLIDVTPDVAVLGFTIAMSVLTGVVFGLAPAFSTTSVGLTSALKEAGAGGGRIRRWSARQVLVVAQIGLCLALVAGAVLLTRTLRNLETRDGGFDRANVLMFSLDASGTVFPPEQIPRFCTDLIERLTTGFDVSAGSCSTSVPINSRGNARPLNVPGSALQRQDVDARLVFMNRVSPGYFRALGINVMGGRVFDSRDSSASERVAVINQSTVRAFFGDADPIGRKIHFHKDDDHPMTVVGIVGDAAQYNLRQDPLNTVYTPLTQLAEPESRVTVALRSRRDPLPMAASLRSEVRTLSPDVVVDYIRTMDDQIASTLVRERLLAMLSSAFGLLALVLSCVGLYGVVAYDVTRRSREFGIRMALGAGRPVVLRQVLRGAATVSALGTLGGLVVAIGATRLLSSLLFGVTARDPLTLVFASAIIIATTLLASYIPARRASSVDPAVVLRAE